MRLVTAFPGTWPRTVGVSGLLLLLVLGLTVAAWFKTEDIVAWALNNRLINEAATHRLPELLREALAAGGLAGLASVVAVIYGRDAVRWFISPVVRCTAAVSSGLGFVLHLGWLGVWFGLRCVWRAMALVSGRVVFTLSRPARYLWLGFSAVAACLWWAGALGFRYLTRGIATVFRLVRAVLSPALDCFAVALGRARASIALLCRRIETTGTVVCGYARGVVSAALARCSTLVQVLGKRAAKDLRCLWSGSCLVLRHVWLGLSLSLGYLWLGASLALRYVWMGALLPLRLLWLASLLLGYLSSRTATLLHWTWIGLRIITRPLLLGTVNVCSLATGGLGIALRYAGVGASTAGYFFWLGISKPLGYLASGTVLLLRYAWTGAGIIARPLLLGIATVLSLAGAGLSAVLRYSGLAAATAAYFLWLGVSKPLGYAWLGVSTAVLVLVWVARSLWCGAGVLLKGLGMSLSAAGRLARAGCNAAPDAWRLMIWTVKNRKGVHSLSEFNLTRERVFALIGTIWAAGMLMFALGAMVWPEPTVQVVHWSNGHLLRNGSGLRLLPQMAEEFNRAGHRTQDGTRIEVKVVNNGSWEQANDLLSRATRGVRVDREKPDPTLVTPSASHWLVRTNHLAGRKVVEVDGAPGLARTLIGIVTYRDMAECLGWPHQEIGYADIIALRESPQGWGSLPCAKAEWGQRPLVAYTDPTTSDTGRGVLLGLYAMAAGTPPAGLTMEDVTRPEVVSQIRRFQGLIDHYLIATQVLNTKVHQGPRYGHFFLMPEDNLIHLYEGTEPYFDNAGAKRTAPPINRPMVMIYPKEGSIPRDNCACMVHAPWVSPEQAEGARKWVSYLREDEQQRSIMAAGFRPATGLPLADPIGPKYGLDPTPPSTVLEPQRIDAAVAVAIDGAWQDVKRPAVVSLVMDTSGSMMGGKLQQAKDGAIRFLDSMAKNNRVGLVTFASGVGARIPVAPLAENRFKIAEAVQQAKASGETALYQAIKAGVEMADAAVGEPDAIRAVVVLTDGRATDCSTALHDLIRMMSRNEVPIRRFAGCDDDAAQEPDGRKVLKQDVVGTGLAIETHHAVQVFFIGIGKDADMQVGRFLAEATGAEFQGATEKDLAEVLNEFSKYF